MGLVVFTGGVRSGKSAAANRMAERCSTVVALAVFGDSSNDPEMAERIARHRAERSEGWRLIEAIDSVEWTERVRDEVLVVDCLCTLLSRVMAEVLAEMDPGDARLASGEDADQDADRDPASPLPPGYEAEVERRFAALTGWILRREGHTIAVTNEVGDGIVPAYPAGRVFRDVLGRANRSLVARAERAYLVVCGRLVDLAVLPENGNWPWHIQGCD